MPVGRVHQRDDTGQRVAADRAGDALAAAGMGVWDWNPITGELIWDDAVARLHGIDPHEFDGQMSTFLGRVHPDDRAALETNINEALASGGTFATEFRVLHPAGTTAWVQGRGYVFTDEAGRPTRMLGVGLDTTTLRSIREQAGRSLDHIGDGLAILDTTGRIVYVNEQAAGATLRPRDEMLGGSLYDVFPEARGSIVEVEFGVAMETQQPRTFEVFHEGTGAWYEFRCFPAPDGLTIFFHDITARRREQREREHLLAAEREAQAHLRMLADASQRLAGSLDHADVIVTLTSLTVPDLADWVVVDLLQTTALHRVAVAHSDPQLSHLADLLTRGDPVPAAGDSPPARVQRTGLALLVESVTGDFIAGFAGTAQQAAVVREMGASTAMVLPLVSRGRCIGALTLFAGRARSPFDADDLSLAEQLASRAALALDNAALYRREHEVADALQQAVLPEQLPVLDGYELAARYVPAASDVKVAGDWYDAFPTGRGTIGLAVGDVAGHGLPAASLMGQMRNALRAYAVQGGPAAVLTELSDLLAAVEPEAMATVVHGELDTHLGRLWWASAGHPPPLFVPQAGVARLLEHEPAPPICALSADIVEPVKAHELWLEPGNVVCWYTDGLIERRDSGLTERLEALRAAGVSLPADTSAEDVCDGLLRSLLDQGDSPDDVCILVLRRLPAP
jgi:PAS domain S-box-containing protein